MAKEENQIPRSTKDVSHTTLEIGVGDRKRTFKLDRIQPFTLGDRRALQNDGVNLSDMTKFGPEDDFKLLKRIFKRAGEDITDEELDTLPAPIVQDIVLYAMYATNEVDRPFSRLSINSPPDTDGGGKK